MRPSQPVRQRCAFLNQRLFPWGEELGGGQTNAFCDPGDQSRRAFKLIMFGCDTHVLGGLGLEFLVHMQVTSVVDGGENWKTIFLKEAERGKELAAAGILRRLWRIPGRRANWGIWRAATADELHAAIASLPMFPHMDITVHPLATHPNDPRLRLDETAT